MYSRSTCVRWRRPLISRWSRHSRRSVPMKRSAIAFARGARTGVRMMRMSAPANTVSKVAGLLGDPGAGGMGGDPGEVYAAGPMLDHDEEVEAAEEDGVDVGEVDRE